MADGWFPLGPCVDGDYLPRRPVEAMEQGGAHRIPLIIGHNGEEAKLFTRMIKRMPLSEAGLEQLLAQADPGHRDRIVAAYPGYPSKQARLQLAGDMFFSTAAWRIATAHQQYAPVYFYRYDYAPWTLRATGLGAAHGTELLAVFGTFRSPAGVVLAGSITHRVASQVVDEVQKRWITFARNGAPGEGWQN